MLPAVTNYHTIHYRFFEVCHLGPVEVAEVIRFTH